MTLAAKRLRAKSLAASAVVRGRQLTSRWRQLPDVVIIGTQRGGTTSLYKYLEHHPDLAASRRKETEYFSLHFARGESWYRAHFPIGEQRSFEATPSYLFHPHAANRAADLVPDAKVICLLREPIARAISHHQHISRLGLDELSFDEAIRAEPERLAGELERLLDDPTYDSIPYRRFSYSTRGIYAPQIERWLARFPAEQILFLESESLFRDPRAVLGDVLDFIGVPRWMPDELRNWSHRGRGGAPADPTISPAIREELHARFAASNQRLAGLIGRAPSWVDAAP